MAEETKSLEQILIERIQKEGLPLLVGDEEAIKALVRKAIDKAIFDPRYERVSYTTIEKLSPLMEEAVRRASNLLLEQMVAGLMADEAFVKVLTDLFIKSIPIAMMNITNSNFTRQFEQDFFKNLDTVGAMVTNWQKNHPAGC